MWSGRWAAIPGFLLLSIVGPEHAQALIVEDGQGHVNTFTQTTASFGLQLPYNVSGSLFFVDEISPQDPYGCFSFDSQSRSVLGGSIALVISTRDCPYSMQVLNAQTAGAIGIIVGGGSGNNDLLRMGCNADYCNNITIPAVYVTETTVAAIKETFAPRLATVNAIGETDPKDPTPTQKLTFFLVVLLIIPIAWCIMVAITLVFKVCSRFASRQIRRQEMRQMPDIPYTLIQETDDDDEEKQTSEEGKRRVPINDTCVICLEEFVPGTHIKILPCKHGFHGDCIDPWLSERSDQCPICKQSVMVDPDRRVCWCIPLERCRACCAANNGNLSPRVTQMIMLLVVAFLAIIVALFFLYPA